MEHPTASTVKSCGQAATHACDASSAGQHCLQRLLHRDYRLPSLDASPLLRYPLPSRTSTSRLLTCMPHAWRRCNCNPGTRCAGRGGSWLKGAEWPKGPRVQSAGACCAVCGLVETCWAQPALATSPLPRAPCPSVPTVLLLSLACPWLPRPAVTSIRGRLGCLLHTCSSCRKKHPHPCVPPPLPCPLSL